MEDPKHYYLIKINTYVWLLSLYIYFVTVYMCASLILCAIVGCYECTEVYYILLLISLTEVSLTY